METSLKVEKKTPTNVFESTTLLYCEHTCVNWGSIIECIIFPYKLKLLKAGYKQPDFFVQIKNNDFFTIIFVPFFDMLIM